MRRVGRGWVLAAGMLLAVVLAVPATAAPGSISGVGTGGAPGCGSGSDVFSFEGVNDDGKHWIIGLTDVRAKPQGSSTACAFAWSEPIDGNLTTYQDGFSCVGGSSWICLKPWPASVTVQNPVAVKICMAMMGCFSGRATVART